MTPSTPSAGPLRAPRQTIRLCLLLLPVWLAGGAELSRFVWLNTTPGPYERNGLVKGRDFVQFYVMGAIAREDTWEELYDVALLERAVARVVPPAAGRIPAPAYGPQVAEFFSSWTRLAYIEARWWWCVTSLLLYLGAAALMVRDAPHLRRHRTLVWLTIALNPALPLVLSTGQTSGFAMAVWVAAVLAFAKGRPFVFGAALGLLVFKPSLIVGAIPVLALLGLWPALVGLAVSAGGQVVLSLPFTGIDPWVRYASSTVNIRSYYYLTDTLPHQKQSLAGFFELLVGSEALAVSLAALASVAIMTLWWPHRSQKQGKWMLAMLIATAVLLSPHLYVYDLVVLLPALLITAEALVRRCETTWERTLAWTGYALLYAPFSGPLAQETGIQVSTILLVIFTIALGRVWNASQKSGLVD